jgi:DNA repair protein RecO (recombination protein O)
MKRNFKTKGIIIRKVDFNEADRIVTVLTDDLGKIDCIAKGARRLKSKFCGRLELFFNVDLICFQGRDLATLNEAHLINGFMEGKDINKHRILFYIAELTNRLIQSGQHIEEAYPLLQKTLSYLEYTDKYEILLHGYLVKLLTITGFLPPWNKCATCNEPLSLDKPVCLSALDANVVCDSCACSADRIIDVPLIKWVNFMQNYPLSDALKVKVKENDHQSVWQWLNGILGNLLSSPIKSEEFLVKA